MAKPRSDAKLKSLPPHQRDMLRTWLVDENLGYKEVKERLKLDFNIETSVGALSEFYATECFTMRYSQARDLAETIGSAMAAEPERFDEATIALVKQKAFERAVAKDGDIKELQILASILGETARLKLKRDELALSLEKFRQQVKSDVEKGLDALHTEIAGNAEAEALFAKLRAAVLRSVDGKEAA